MRVVSDVLAADLAWSRTLAPTERNYSASERECLAGVCGITTCRPYLFAEHFIVNTDHADLCWLMESSDTSGSVMRSRLRLAEYSFDVNYKQVKLDCLADAVSRIASTGHTVEGEDADIPCYTAPSTGNEDSESDLNIDPDFGWQAQLPASGFTRDLPLRR